jgi:hypothetical protein
MKTNLITSLYRYFEALFELNQTLIILHGIDILDGNCYKYIEKIFTLLPKLIPYKNCRNDNTCYLANNDGLLCFSNEIPFLAVSYQAILDDHSSTLIRIKKVRNKLEHSLHNVRITRTTSVNSDLSIEYDIKGNEIEITIDEIVAVVKRINTLYYDIQCLLENDSANHTVINEPYYRKMVEFLFVKFNEIYESDFLFTCGRLMLPF